MTNSSVSGPVTNASNSISVLTYEEALKVTRNTQLAYYVLAAHELGISYRMLIPGLFAEFSKGPKRWRIHKALTPINDSVAMSLAAYKNICNRFLKDNGFPVPRQASINAAEDIFTFIKELGHDNIVIKPSRGWGGMGVSILPRGDQDVRHAFNSANENSLATSSTKVLAEEFVHGRHFRLVVLGTHVIAATERIPPSVTGDGTSSIETLVSEINKAYTKTGRPTIKLDEESDEVLESQNMARTSVPEAGKTVIIRFNANMTSGGRTRECLSDLHHDYLKLAVDVVDAVGLKLAGLDLITPDPADPSVKHAINEVNHNPGLRLHYMPDEGEPTDICLTIQQYILDNI
ncbi:MAG: ATP-grasp domain-containing protein [Candidatus Dojkabacteria bacterium]|nr:ATP-grasp domain-containing protein [Candidatus Dojkabacteria bacterium]